MHALRLATLLLLLCGWVMLSLAAETDFSGVWSIDLRTEKERKKNVGCGHASFELLQVETTITGNHTFATPGCGQLNEGGEGSVKGLVIGSASVLVVVSGRNGAVVMGKATRTDNSLHWETVEEIKRGEPDGDSPLILSKGRLIREKSAQRHVK